MELLGTVRIAVRALGRHKLRTFLTMLGMIIGVAAVMTMVALGSGAQASVEDEMKSAGTNLVYMSAGNYTRGGDDIKVASGLGAAQNARRGRRRRDPAQVSGIKFIRQASAIVRRWPMASAGSSTGSLASGASSRHALLDHPPRRHDVRATDVDPAGTRGRPRHDRGNGTVRVRRSGRPVVHHSQRDVQGGRR